MFIIKREMLAIDFQSIREIDYEMFVNFSTASDKFDTLKAERYCNSCTLYEVINTNIGFKNVEEIVAYIFSHNKYKVVDSFDKKMLGAKNVNTVIINGNELSEVQASLLNEVLIGAVNFGIQTPDYIKDEMDMSLEEASNIVMMLSSLFN